VRDLWARGCKDVDWGEVVGERERERERALYHSSTDVYIFSLGCMEESIQVVASGLKWKLRASDCLLCQVGRK
jgi:hypothetical protein